MLGASSKGPSFEEVAAAYDLLGLPQSATKDDLTRAFRRLARAAHPDRQGGASPDQYLELTRARDLIHAEIEKGVPGSLKQTLGRLAYRRGFLRAAANYFQEAQTLLTEEES